MPTGTAAAFEEMLSYLFLRQGKERERFFDMGEVDNDCYEEFLSKKVIVSSPAGKEIDPEKIHPFLYQFQADVTRWALHKGRAAVFLETGLGKTFIAGEWARHVGGICLIFAPLTVSKQTIKEARKIDLEIFPVRHKDDLRPGVNITNYEMINHFIGANLDGIILDESSCIKHETAIRKKILFDHFTHIPYRLCCTATPCPNDIAELANHSQFLGIMKREDMLSSFFVHDDQIWRLRGHAKRPFYRWLSSWAIAMKNPYDLGYDGSKFVLPPLNINEVIVRSNGFPTGRLLPGGLRGIQDRVIVRRNTHKERAVTAAEIANLIKGQVIVWTGLNEESELVSKLIPDSIEVKGSDSVEFKEEAIWDFMEGKHRVLVTKVKIAGMGMNFQNASTMIFLGLGDSQEQYYQAIRRCWRYRQQNPVNVYVVVSDYEKEVVENVRRKEKDSIEMVKELIAESKDFSKAELHKEQERVEVLERKVHQGEGWMLYQGDSAEVLRELPEESVDLSLHSPPFLSLYQYSATERDLGNSKNESEFFEHYGFITRELLRVTKKGRICAVHVSQVPAMLIRDGYIGLKDFRGQCVVEYQKNGWIYHGEVVIQKNPQVQAVRKKVKGLLFAQLKKDASWLRPGLADYILFFRKPGENKVPILPDITNEQWISWAHPVWFDIAETNTLNAGEARGNDDDRHICPLQLGVIERVIRLFSNMGEMVLSPFAGIGSEGYVSLQWKRQFLGVELKSLYCEVAIRNLRQVEQANQLQLFS